MLASWPLWGGSEEGGHMLKKVLVAFITLGLIAAPILSVQAQSEDEIRYISLAFAADRVDIDASDYVVLGYGWVACTRGLVRVYLTGENIELGIDNRPHYIADGKDQYWGPIVSTEDEDAQQYCIAGDKIRLWSAHWDYPLGILEPGEHTVYYHHWLDHPVTDGGDYNGDGQIDTPNLYEIERTITIVVSE
jgi:hypothetical protein